MQLEINIPISQRQTKETHRRNILLMNLSLFTGFLFFPFGISVHICNPGINFYPLEY